MGSTKAIPKKCFECENQFEGECLRAINQVESYLSLDYGRCKKNGNCEPTIVENQFIKSKTHVPYKCTDCSLLKYHSIFGFTCHENEEIWGPYGKTLDWGHWSPNLPNLGLKSGKLVSTELIEAVNTGSEVSAIKIFRKINLGSDIKEAREAFSELSSKLRNNS